MFIYCFINVIKINPNCCGSHLYSLDWIKKATIIKINKKGSKCFQYTATVALNHEEIKKNFAKNKKN